MASVQMKELFSGKLSAGASTTIPWKNPPKHVVNFWVAPPELPDEGIFLGKLPFQITKVLSMMDQPNHFRIEVTIKNSGTVEGPYKLYGYYLA